MKESKFTFELGEQVQMTLSEENGNVVARAEHQDSDAQYLIEYIAGNKRQVRSWWFGSSLKKLD